ncbi:MAG: bifunctional diaminohydroxyphosphoribosylaminopyrimidine deaminase/5-amino-6-(5-phosphoribosylamino)uracil reductase RibD [Blastocatellia bacterium]
MTDSEFIQLTLDLAAEGKGQVSPNPLVGCVIVHQGRVVGRGFHRYNEIKHAEAWALDEAGAQARGATAYVSLEPCSHSGHGKRTAPCSQALIDAGITRVVAAMVDPNPRVDGRGFDLLRGAGLDVSVGWLENEARRLNEKYVRYVTMGRPFVHLKTACSLDGRIATRTGESKWITNEQSRAAAQLLRHEYDAILVGVNTALADDPLLTDRSGRPRRRPLTRVILDASLRTPPQSQLAQSAREFPVLIFTATDELVDNMGFPIYSSAGLTLAERRAALEQCGAKIIPIASDGGLLDLASVLDVLGARRLTSLLVEGGAEIAASFIEHGLVDKLTAYLAPIIIGGHEAKPAIGGAGAESLSAAMRLRHIETRLYGDDVEVTGYPVNADCGLRIAE